MQRWEKQEREAKGTSRRWGSAWQRPGAYDIPLPVAACHTMAPLVPRDLAVAVPV